MKMSELIFRNFQVTADVMSNTVRDVRPIIDLPSSLDIENISDIQLLFHENEIADVECPF